LRNLKQCPGAAKENESFQVMMVALRDEK